MPLSYILYAYSALFNLHKLQFNRCSPAENGYGYAKLAFVRLDILHHTGKVQERSVNNTHSLPNLEQDFGTRFFCTLFHSASNLENFLLGNGKRGVATNKTGNFSGLLDDMPGFVRQDHLDEYITGEEFA